MALERRRETTVDIVYGGDEHTSLRAMQIASDLWVEPYDFQRVTGWELKDEGVCKGELCVALRESDRSNFIRSTRAGDWFNVTQFARLIDQAFAHDSNNRVWYFGPPSWEWDHALDSRQAPDFTLPDLRGTMHSLADSAGRKRFLLFWASY